MQPNQLVACADWPASRGGVDEPQVANHAVVLGESAEVLVRIATKLPPVTQLAVHYIVPSLVALQWRTPAVGAADHGASSL